jgi:hypothetical protein
MIDYDRIRYITAKGGDFLTLAMCELVLSGGKPTARFTELYDLMSLADNAKLHDPRFDTISGWNVENLAKGVLAP